MEDVFEWNVNVCSRCNWCARWRLCCCCRRRRSVRCATRWSSARPHLAASRRAGFLDGAAAAAEADPRAAAGLRVPWWPLVRRTTRTTRARGMCSDSRTTRLTEARCSCLCVCICVRVYRNNLSFQAFDPTCGWRQSIPQHCFPLCFPIPICSISDQIIGHIDYFSICPIFNWVNMVLKMLCSLTL